MDGTKRELSAAAEADQGRAEGGGEGAEGTRRRRNPKRYKAEIKRLEKEIPDAERDLKLLTNRGKLELILADAELIGTLKERWIAAEVAKRLDYPIFMAVSERGGKNNSGDYEYLLDEDGRLVEDPAASPRSIRTW